jgi:hypothetical protein
MSIIGAIRWDAWYSWTQGGLSEGVQKQFSVAGLQSRAPWFAQVASPYQLKCVGTQANVDTECQMAATAGIDYFAFDCYQPGNAFAFASTEMSQAWTYYQASPNNHLTKWCWITFPNHWSSANFADNSWQAFLTTVATQHCKQTNYQKVMGNRPLVFIFGVNSAVNTSQMATAVSYFRNQCTSVGLGTPYMVMQTDGGGSAAQLMARATACGLDAVSNYATPVLQEWRTPIPGSYDTLDTGMQGVWAAQAAAGKVIPTGCCGWDTRCRIAAPEANTATLPRVGGLLYWSNPTPARAAQHVQSLMSFVANNPTACEAQAALLYSWTECTEGSVRALIPTLGDPPVGGTTNLLTAVKGVLRP